MPSKAVFDIDALVQPISDENPCGIDLRENANANSLYYQIKDARQAARAAERANMFDSEESANLINNWKPVAELAPKILAKESKDLEIASWYLEALIRLNGFQGLADGLELIEQLIQHCWEGIYPLPDEDGLETTVNALSGLNGISGEGSLIAPMRNAPITPTGDMGEFSFWHYQQARDTDKIADADKKETKIASLGFSLNSIEQLIHQSENGFCIDLMAYLNRAVAAFSSINKMLREKCGDLAPPSSHIQSTLEEIQRTFRHIAKDKLIEESAASQVDSNASDDLDAQTSAHSEQSTPAHINTGSNANTYNGVSHRAEAFQKMQEACDYFRIHEPHTPLVSALERLIRWGHMPLHELMAELMPDPTARAFYTQLTGAPVGYESSADMTTLANYEKSAQIAGSGSHSLSNSNVSNNSNSSNSISGTSASTGNQAAKESETTEESGDELKW